MVRRPRQGPLCRQPAEGYEGRKPWQHYLLTEADIYQPDAQGRLAKAVTPYIEGVIHPTRTSCRNCHVRAGYPGNSGKGPADGTTGYSNPNCPDLLAVLRKGDDCFKGVTLSDFAWIIPDRAH
ncbi:MAG: hypothetical protein QNJ43_06495 [Breoghania sp.]|nr:hypothetical protein [Breoghania sp.]